MPVRAPEETVTMLERVTVAVLLATLWLCEFVVDFTRQGDCTNPLVVCTTTDVTGVIGRKEEQNEGPDFQAPRTLKT